MSAYGVERCIGWVLLAGVVLWFLGVAGLCWRDERRARWLQDEADADEFVRSLREHPAGHAIVVPPPPNERRCAVLERRAAWLRRRIAERPEASSFDRRELDALGVGAARRADILGTTHVNNACPSCGRKFDDATNVYGGVSSPSAGDASICLYCGEFAVFTGDGLGLRKPTDDELSELQADPEVRRARVTLAMFNMAKARSWRSL